MIDSGWDRTVDCPQVLEGVGVVAEEDPFEVGISDDRDRVGHGTAVADIILSIAPAAELIPVRVFGDRLETSIRVLAAGLDVAALAEVHLVNLSIGTFLTYAEEALAGRCARLASAGAFVVAAGHERWLGSYPAVFDTVIGVLPDRCLSDVGLIHRPDETMEFFARSSRRDVLCLNGGRQDVQGSSFATPFVTGIAALAVERYRPSSVEDLRQILASFAGSSVSGGPGCG